MCGEHDGACVVLCVRCPLAVCYTIPCGVLDRRVSGQGSARDSSSLWLQFNLD
jgi:hypothetical protein